MTEKKLKPAAKKTATSKTRARAATTKSQATSSKPETSKTKVATADKKAASGKPATVATKKTKTIAVKKAAIPAAGKKTPARKVAVKKAATSVGKEALSEKAIAYPTPEERYRMVETAAYFIAEQHGFQGRAEEHWVAAEREIAARLGR